MPEKIVLEQDKNIKTKEVERPVDTPADFTSPEVLYQDLITEIKKYHPSSDLSDIEKAYKVAYKAHEGQKRKSGEPYIIHPLCVAIILAELELDKESIIAGLLHDVVEDHGSRYSFAYLEQAGFPEAVIHALHLLTHTTGVPYMDYVKELAKDPIARKVKLTDLKHNLDARRLNAARPRKYDLYLQAIRYLEEIEQKPDVK